MGLFSRNKNTNKDQVQHYNLKNKLFPVSKPWGYSPQHVEEAIQGYTNVIENQKVAISKLKEEVTFYKKRYDQLETEFKNLQLQLNFVSVPSMNDIQEEYIQGKFKEKFQQSRAPENKDPFSDYDENRSADQILEESYSSPQPQKSKLSMIAEESNDSGESNASNSNSNAKPEKKFSFSIKRKPSTNEEENVVYGHDVDDEEDGDDEQYDDDDDEEDYASEFNKSLNSYDDDERDDYDDDDDDEEDGDDSEDYDENDYGEAYNNEDGDDDGEDGDDDEYQNDNIPDPPNVEPSNNESTDPSAEFLKNFGF